MNKSIHEVLPAITEQLGEDPAERLCELLSSDLIISEFRRFTDSYYSLDSPSQNIAGALRCVINIYESDAAFLVVIDENIEAFRVIASEYRNGLEDFSNALLDGITSTNLFEIIINPTQEYCFNADDIKEKHSYEYEWMSKNGVSDLMLSPLLSRTQLVAFIGTCNTRRLYSDMTMLRLARVMLAPDLRGVMVMGNLTLEQSKFSALESNDIVINMFGGFEIRTCMGSLDLSGLAPSKCSLMLIYLLFNSNRTVSVRELAEILWPDQLFDNPGPMVKSVAFRLRKLLTPICNSGIILAKQGTYVLSDELVIIKDTDNFTHLCDLLEKREISAHDRQKIYERAMSVYKGNLLPNFEDEIWLIGQMSYYQLKYWGLIKEYLLFLEETNQYELFFRTASHTMNIMNPDGEIYFMMIRVMLRQGRHDLAKNCYLRAEKLFTPEQKQYFLNVWRSRSL